MRPSGRALLDTNIVIALFTGDPSVLESIEHQTELFLCVPVLGELRYGALASSRVEQNLVRLDHFSEPMAVLDCDVETVPFYASIKVHLRKQGRPIPDNDAWIAAIARQHKLTLITRDSHFKQVRDLELELL